jgi:hypothetical protein
LRGLQAEKDDRPSLCLLDVPVIVLQHRQRGLERHRQLPAEFGALIRISDRLSAGSGMAWVAMSNAAPNGVMSIAIPPRCDGIQHLTIIYPSQGIADRIAAFPSGCNQYEQGEKMAHHDENFRDPAGFGWLFVNILALLWITMPVSIALAKIVQW